MIAKNINEKTIVSLALVILFQSILYHNLWTKPILNKIDGENQDSYKIIQNKKIPGKNEFLSHYFNQLL